MLTLRDFLWAVVVPLAVSSAALLLVCLSTRGRIAARYERLWAGPAAVAIGFVGGWYGLFGRPEFPPSVASDWLFYLALPWAAWGVVECRWLLPTHVRLGLIAVGCGLSLGLAAWCVVRASDESGLSPLTLTLAACATTVWIVVVGDLAGRVSSVRWSVILLSAIAPASAALLAGGSTQLAQLCGILAASMAGLLVVNLALGGGAGFARGVSPVVGIAFGGLLLCGQLDANLPAAAAALLFLAPVAAWFAQNAPRHVGPLPTARLRRVGVQIAPVLVLDGLALLMAYWQT